MHFLPSAVVVLQRFLSYFLGFLDISMCDIWLSVFDCFPVGLHEDKHHNNATFSKVQHSLCKSRWNLRCVKILYSWFEVKGSHPLQRLRVLNASLVEGTFCAYSFFTVSSNLSPAISRTSPVTFTCVKSWPRFDGSSQKTDDEDGKETVFLIPCPVHNPMTSCPIRIWASSLCRRVWSLMPPLMFWF